MTSYRLAVPTPATLLPVALSSAGQSETSVPWNDATMIAMTRDTRAWITRDPNNPNATIGDWYDTRPHGLILYSIAKWIAWPDPRQPRPLWPPRCLEIGTRHGVTTLFLAQAMREANGLLISLEMDATWGQATRDEIVRAQLDSWWRLEVVHSDDYAARATADAPFDFIFLDGEHSEDQVRRDVTNFLPLLQQGGIFALHDYYSLPWPCTPAVQPPFPSYVSVIVDELRATGRYEIFILPFSFGLALIRLSGETR